MNKYVKLILLSITSTLAYCSTYLISTSVFAGKYDTYSFLGKTKDLLSISQIVGYFVGKIIGLKIFELLGDSYRLPGAIITYVLATVPYILFSFSSPVGQIISIFLSGIFLSLTWGFIIFYIEGEYGSEIIIMFIYMGLIASSGISKTVGAYFIGLVTENIMPLVCASIGLVLAIIFTVVLSYVQSRYKRDSEKRLVNASGEHKELIKKYWFGLTLISLTSGVIYAYKNYRDYYAYEIWTELYGNDFIPEIYSISETGVSVVVTLAYMLLFFVKSARVCVYIIFLMMLTGGVTIGVSSVIIVFVRYNPLLWIILIGIGVMIAFIPPGALLYDKLMTAMEKKITSVFLIYISDICGPVLTAVLITIKSYGCPDMTFVKYFEVMSYITSVIVVLAMAITVVSYYMYFKELDREKSIILSTTVETVTVQIETDMNLDPPKI
jgi:hypothetical protein